MDWTKDGQILEPTASLQCGWWKCGVDLFCSFSEANRQLTKIWLKSETWKHLPCSSFWVLWIRKQTNKSLSVPSNLVHPRIILCWVDNSLTFSPFSSFPFVVSSSLTEPESFCFLSFLNCEFLNEVCLFTCKANFSFLHFVWPSFPWCEPWSQTLQVLNW